MALEKQAGIEEILLKHKIKPKGKLPNLKPPQGRVKKLLCIALDTSGSMNENIFATSSKMEIAWEALTKELAPNLMNYNYSILLFCSNDIKWLFSLSNNPYLLMNAKVPEAHDNTPMHAALNAAWTHIESKSEQARIILITDGCPTDSEPVEILRDVQKHSNIPIDCVGIGQPDYSNYDPGFLQLVSSTTNGMFVEAHDAKKLLRVIKELSPAERPMLGSAGVR